MRLFYHPRSTCSRRVLMTAHHLNCTLDLVLVDLFKGAQHAPDFLCINPNRKVPVLVDGDLVLWESYAIMQYLADQAPRQTLYPSEVKNRADINRWLFWCAQSFMPGASILNWENAVKPIATGENADPSEVVRGEQLLGDAGQLLDQHLAEREWICGQNVSLADFAIAAPLADQQRAKFPVLHLKHIQHWLARVQRLNAWKATENVAPTDKDRAAE